MPGKDQKKGGLVDYDQLGYTRAEAQARYDKQAAFCASGGTLDTSSGQWKKDGKVVGDPAGPFNPGCGDEEGKKKGR